jgi:molecular chaperone HscB
MKKAVAVAANPSTYELIASSTMLKDFFSLLGLLPAFDIDLQALEAAYFKTQRQYHPDRFIGKPDAERQKALLLSADANQAYDTLADPLKRARYLLLTHGIFIGTDKDTVKPSQELLMEVMEWGEGIEKAQSLSQLYAESDKLNATREAVLHAISQSYTKAQWDEMAQLTLKLGYIEKTLEDIKRQQAKLKP